MSPDARRRGRCTRCVRRRPRDARELPQRAEEDAPHRVAPVERRVGVLEDDLQRPAAAPRDRFWNRGASARAVEDDRRPSSARRGRAGRARASSCRDPDSPTRPERLARPDGGRDVDERVDLAAVLLEDLPEPVELDERAPPCGRRPGARGPRASARGKVCARSWYQQRARVAVAERLERRLLGGAALVRERAAVDEDASGELGAELRQEAGDRVEPAVVLADAAARDAAEQADGVRVPRVLEDRLDGTLLDEPAGVEDADAVAHLRDRAEVVADEEDRGVELRLELGDEVEDLRLDRRVEAGRRLVEDQERRVLGERHRDHDPLLHAAGELVRVAAHHRARRPRSAPARARRGRARRPRACRTPSTENASATCVPTRSPGFSAAPGFW